jgi:RNA polymerase sigma-70 factor (ECF subfamily)
MNEWAGRFPRLEVGAIRAEPPGLVNADDTLEQEFVARLRESSSLAFRVAYAVLRQREDAEDVAQEAFVRAHARIGQLRDRTRFRAWLVRMCWRLAIDRIRSETRRAARELTVESEGSPSPEQLAEARERSRRLWMAIDALPEKLRIVVVLAAIEGHDVTEVARLLDIPEGTVKSRLFLARKRLGERLRCLANDTRRP